jgi:ribosome maturation factor RimP
MSIEKKLTLELDRVIKGMGFEIVELKAKHVSQTLHVSLVVYRQDGVGINECVEIHRTVLPRLEVLLDTRDIHLEVSSPGLDRTIKSNREFGIFIGRTVRILRSTTGEWVNGVILASGETSCTVDTGQRKEDIPFDTIQKARLDDSEEER